MKSAMKRMLDYIQAVQDDNFNSDIEYIKENCIQLLELEKQQIIESFKIGLNSDCLQEQNEQFFAEEYYNKTFKL